MRSPHALALTLSLALPVAVWPGCGGNVVVDKEVLEPDPAACRTVCPKIQDACPGQTDSCELMCETYDRFADSGACLDQTADYFVCLDAHPASACGGGDASCSAEEDALAACFVDFCMAQPGGC